MSLELSKSNTTSWSELEQEELKPLLARLQKTSLDQAEVIVAMLESLENTHGG